MATNTADATGAPVEFTMDGETFRLSPFRDADLGEFERHVRSTIIAMAREACAGASEEDKRAAFGAAYSLAARINITSAEAKAQMATKDGMARMLWLGLRRQHKGLAFERVRELMDKEENIESAALAMEQANPKLPKKTETTGATTPTES